MREIPLTRGFVALVDDEDYEKVLLITWCAVTNGGLTYARSQLDGRQVYMHRFLLSVPGDKLVDHIDGDSLNNQKSNIRICSYQENNHNARPQKGASSAYKGVSSFNGSWAAGIRINNKKKHLGIFKTETEAAVIYNEAARDNFGEFAWVNKIPHESVLLDLFSLEKDLNKFKANFIRIIEDAGDTIINYEAAKRQR